MTDTEPSRPDPAASTRTFLWAVVVAGAVVNMAASYRGAPLWVHLACGAVTALSIGVLVVARLREHP